VLLGQWAVYNEKIFGPLSATSWNVTENVTDTTIGMISGDVVYVEAMRNDESFPEVDSNPDWRRGKHTQTL